jgi:hypothetical protein
MSRRTSLATRKQRGDAEELRKHVQIDQLIDRLMAHACSPKPLMDGSQVQSALVLLNKLLPDLSVTQLITGDADSPLANTAVEWRVVNAIPDKSDDDSSDCCAQCGARIPSWRNGRKVSSATRFCSDACAQKARRAA